MGRDWRCSFFFCCDTERSSYSLPSSKGNAPLKEASNICIREKERIYSPSSLSSAISTGLFTSLLKLVLIGLINSALDLSILNPTGLLNSALGLSKLLLLLAFASSLRRIPSGLYQAAGVLSCMKSPSRVWLPVWA